jgi:hypothetical protein
MVLALSMCGMGLAQYESYWPDFDYHAYSFQGAFVGVIELDGAIVQADTHANWDALEVAFFVNGVCRGSGAATPGYNPMINYLYNGYVEEWGDPYPVIDGAPVYYENGGEVVTVMIYDHMNEILYEDVTVTLEGEPFTILTGDDNVQGWWDPENPIILSITSPEMPTQTFTKDIVGYGDVTNARGYYLIASPIVEEVTPSAENGFLTTAYDLYFFDGSYPAEEWRNYKVDAFTLTNGKGYLYASQEDTQLTFTGTPYSGDGVVELGFNEGTDFGGWNLIGNPFPEQALPNRSYYILNTEEEGGDFIASSGGVEAMEGIMVYAEAEGDSVTFIPSNKLIEGGEMLTLSLSKSCVRGLVDRAIVNFGEGRTLPKFQMNPNHTKVYIPQDGTDYAVVSAPEMGEMPVNFKAETNGSYTMSFGSENVTFSYLHLIDNLTGADVDLLATPSYTFDASTTDYASRFRLVFATGGNSDGDSFAFFSNGSFVVSNEGEATLQVVDVMGRILKSENISGSASVKVDGASGVYMLRLVNGNDVKVQKVVVE